MRVHHIIILAITAAALIGGLLLLPRPEEQVTMLFRDGRVEIALRDLEEIYAAGDRRQHIVSQLAAGNANAGNPERAMALLEDYIAEHPRDAAMRLQIAKLYLSTQRYDDYVNALEVSMSLRPTAELLRRLLGVYRLNGQFDSEERLVLRYLEEPFFPQQDLVRAASLLAARGNLPTAAKALMLADDKLPAREEFARVMLFDVLVAVGNGPEAVRRASTWIKTRRKSYLAVLFAKKLAKAGFERDALALVALTRKAIPRLDAVVAYTLSKEGYVNLARQMLSAWASRIEGSDEREIREYIAAAAAANDATGPFVLLQKVLRENASPQVQGLLIEELGMAFGLQRIAPFRQLLSYDALATRPVFAAGLALYEGNPLLARKFLVHADPEVMTVAQRTQWLELSRKVEPDAVVFQRFSALWRDNKLPLSLLPALAQLAFDLGRTREYNEIWRSVASSRM